MNKFQRQVFISGLIATITGFLIKSFYRDYINTHHIDDLGFAGFLPSYFYVIGFSLLLLVRPWKYPIFIILVVTSISILYECMQAFSQGVFDIKDALASLLGGITSYALLRMILRNSIP